MALRVTPSIIKPDQVLLLKAALFPAAEALISWQLWKKAYNLDHVNAGDANLLPRIFDPIDHDSQRLMPMVYRNLEKSDDPLIPHLRGIYRYTWMSNQRFLLKMKQVVRALQAAQIDTLVLKGIPLSLLYYGDLGVRFMSDLDILVPTTQADQALRVLQQEPTSLKGSKYEYKYRHLIHAMHLFDASKVDMDLHQNLMSQHAYTRADSPFWESPRPLQLDDAVSTHTLSPTHQLFHNLVHGFGWGITPAIRWVADSYVIYTNPDIAIDWHHLLDLTERYHLRFPVRQAIRLLQADFRLVLPTDVSERLNRWVLSSTEQTYFTLLDKKTSNPVGKTVRFLQKNWLAYQLFQPEKPALSLAGWLYGQLRFRLSWPNRNLPF